MTDGHPLLEPLRTLHGFIRDRVVDACTRQTTDTLAAVAADGPGDTIYRIEEAPEASAEQRRFRQLWLTGQTLSATSGEKP